MSTQPPPPNDKAPKTEAAKGLLPPEPKFWQRYSRHQELPLSGVGSFTLHFLAIGFMVLVAIGIIRFGGSNNKLPMEAVRIGGGGGRPDGEGNGPGAGQPDSGPKEDVKDIEAKPPSTATEQKQLALDNAKPPETKVDFDNKQGRFVKDTTESAMALNRLAEETQRKLKLRGTSASPGQGGSGKGGGQGAGDGTGVGDTKGPGTQSGSLTQREKRMLRWSMTFNTKYDGGEYIRQLAGLGAILAIPKDQGNPPSGYNVIRNLRQRPPELKEEDLSEIQRIYWVDDRPDSVRSLLRALGLRMEASHVIAFMPDSLEKHLFEIEHAYRNLPEEAIFETRFEVVRKAGGYEPRVVSQKAK